MGRVHHRTCTRSSAADRGDVADPVPFLDLSVVGGGGQAISVAGSAVSGTAHSAVLAGFESGPEAGQPLLERRSDSGLLKPGGVQLVVTAATPATIALDLAKVITAGDQMAYLLAAKLCTLIVSGLSEDAVEDRSSHVASAAPYRRETLAAAR
jgi:hypothetical protein